MHLGVVAIVLGCGIIAGLAAEPGAAPGSVPPAWSVFALHVTLQFQDELSDQTDPAALRLHQFLDSRVPPDQSVVLRVWFNRDGRISRAEFPSLGDQQADRDLRAVLTARTISVPPPPDMRQPLVLRISLTVQS